MKNALLFTVSSDSHSWNLVFMEYLLTEKGFNVKNLGTCTPIDEVVYETNKSQYDLLVLSTVNGHGYLEGPEISKLIRGNENYHNNIVIGGKISTDNSKESIELKTKLLKQAGFDAVFDDSNANIFDDFEKYLVLLDSPCEEMRAFNDQPSSRIGLLIDDRF